MASCWAVTGLVLVALAFIASAIALVAPYWYQNAAETGHTGLWAACGTHRGNLDIIRNDDCVWFFESDFTWEKNQEDWWKAVQGLFTLGVLGILIAFLIACINLCCACCKASYSFLHVINGLLVLSFLELAVAIAVFGVKANQDRKVQLQTDIGLEFYWAFWVGAGGAVLDLLAVIFYSIAGCRGDGHAGYTRGEVV